MIRLLKFLPVLIPIASKLVKSPQGQRAIASLRARLARRGGSGAQGR